MRVCRMRGMWHGVCVCVAELLCLDSSHEYIFSVDFSTSSYEKSNFSIDFAFTQASITIAFNIDLFVFSHETEQLFDQFCTRASK